jgi:hypothetical protein
MWQWVNPISAAFENAASAPEAAVRIIVRLEPSPIVPPYVIGHAEPERAGSTSVNTRLGRFDETMGPLV